MSLLNVTSNPSPNFDTRANAQMPDMLVLHYTGMQSGREAIARLKDPVAKVSAHYVVEENGNIIQLVDEKNRAWHAGGSHWAGVDGVNGCSIGVEIVNPGHEWGYTEFPDAQMQAVLSLSKEIVARYNIAKNRVLGHSDVAPDRKQDPGELFNWRLLAEHGVGFVVPDNLSDGDEVSAQSPKKEISDLQLKLQQFGYGLDVSGEYDAATKACVTAFQRHWHQAGVTGVASKATVAKLNYLLLVK